MDVDDLIEDVQEEVHALEEEEVKDARDRLAILTQTQISIDKQLEELDGRLGVLEHKVEQIIDELKEE